tara:strand:- start:399 stop:1217 length:819 start_codon:yes stop_codon:yes gene_type:complete
MSDLNVGSLNLTAANFASGNTQTVGIASLSDVPGMHTSVMSANTGQALVFDGSTYAAGDMGGRLLSINVYTSQNGTWNSYNTSGGSGTWTKPAGCTHVLVYCTGGGGGARVNDNSYRGAGGGGGATSIKWIDVSGVASVSYTYGGGGTYARNGGRGASGGTSSFGGYMTAGGGQGGQTDVPHQGGPGGNASGGDINVPGGGGEMSHGHNREGGGGSSIWHKSGSSHHYYNNQEEVTSGQWGSGGGYGYYSQNGFAHNSSQGGAGVVIVYNYS